MPSLPHIGAGILKEYCHNTHTLQEGATHKEIINSTSGEES